jgi:hypothetical protein
MPFHLLDNQIILLNTKPLLLSKPDTLAEFKL